MTGPEQDTDAGSIEFTLTSSPTVAFHPGPVTMLVGLEDGPDGLRAYLGARYKGIYLLVDERNEDAFRRAWGSTFMGHCWMYPVPPAEMLHQDEPAGCGRSTVPGVTK